MNNPLRGYVTYIAAAAFVALAIADLLTGEGEKASAHLVEALGLFGLRRAIGGTKD